MGNILKGFYDESGCIWKDGTQITNWIIVAVRWQIRKGDGYEEDWGVLKVKYCDTGEELNVEIPLKVINSGNILKYLPDRLMILGLSDTSKKRFLREYITCMLMGVKKETVQLLSQGYSKIQDSYVYVAGDKVINPMEVAGEMRIESDLHLKKVLLQYKDSGAIAWMMSFLKLDENIMPTLFLGAVVSVLTPFLRTIGIDTAFVLYLVGDTATGKSSVAKLLTEIYEEKNYWTVSSDMADLRKCMNDKRHFLFLLDDLNKTETSRVKNSKESKVSEIIQQVSNNDTVASKGVSSHFEGSLLVTAEYTLKNHSSMNRCVVLNMPSCLDMDTLSSLQKTQGIYIVFLIKFIIWLCAEKDKHMEVIQTLNDCGLTKKTYNPQAYDGIARIERSEHVLNIAKEFLLRFLQEEMKLPQKQIQDLRKIFETSISHCIDDTRDLVRKEDVKNGREYVDVILGVFVIQDRYSVARNYKKYKAARQEKENNVIFFRSKDCVCITGDDLVRLIEEAQDFQYDVSKQAISRQLVYHGMLKVSGGEFSISCTESGEKSRYYHIYINKIKEMMSGEELKLARMCSPLKELRQSNSYDNRYDEDDE